MKRMYPNHWVITELENVGKITTGNPAPQEKQYFRNGIIPFVRVADLGQLGNSVYIHNTKDKINKKINNQLKLYPKGSVLFTKSGMSLLLNQRAILGSGMYVVSHIGIVLPTQEISSEWIYYWLKTIDFKKYAHATTLPSLKISLLRKMDFPLPPINEQNRIVEKIEELFSDLDKATEDLKKTQELLKIYCQAVLKAAFEGNKTSNWKQMKLGGLIKVKSGNGLTRSQRLSSGIFFVYGGNGILGKHTKYMFEETKLIIGRVGVNCGNVHITRPKSWVTDNAFIVSYDNEKACQEYLLYYLEFLNLNKYAGSTAQPVISGHKIYPIDIKLPNKKEQFEIFSKIEKNFSIINKLKETVQQGLEKIEYLRHSILKKVFEGKLVPQDPNDEPAEKLLERIKQEKEKFESNNKKRKKR